MVLPGGVSLSISRLCQGLDRTDKLQAIIEYCIRDILVRVITGFTQSLCESRFQLKISFRANSASMSSGNEQDVEPTSKNPRKSHISDNHGGHSPERIQTSASISSPTQTGAVRQITGAVSPGHTPKSPSLSNIEARASSPSLTSTETTRQVEPADTTLHGAMTVAPAVSSGGQHRKGASLGPSGKAVQIVWGGPMPVAQRAEFVDVPLRDAEDEKREKEMEEDKSWERLDCPAHLRRKK